MRDIFLTILAMAIVVGVIRPLFWWLALGFSLWIGRKVCSPRWGRRIFGHYWKRVDK